MLRDKVVETRWLNETIRRAKSWQYYVPLSCLDIQLLENVRSLNLGARVLPQFCEKQQPFFFGNHPIKWVNVSGRVVNVQDKGSRVLLEVADGSGETVAVMVTGALAFTLSGRHSSIRLNSFVIVNGILVENQWGRTVNAQRLSYYDYPVLAAQLVTAYEAMVVRREFLELPCDYTGPVSSASYPDNSKTLYGMLGDKYTDAGRTQKGPPDFVIP